jgi:flavodoxin
MSKVLVLYCSTYGHVETIATAVAAGVAEVTAALVEGRRAQAA